MRSARQRALRQVVGMAGAVLGNPRFMKEDEAAIVNQFLRGHKSWVPSPPPINGFGPTTDSEAGDELYDVANYAQRSARVEDEALGGTVAILCPFVLSAQSRGDTDAHPSLSKPSPSVGPVHVGTAAGGVGTAQTAESVGVVVLDKHGAAPCRPAVGFP